MPKIKIAAAGLAAAWMVSAAPVLADTGSVKAWEVVRIDRMGTHCADDKNCFNRMHPAIPPVMTAKPGQHIVFSTRDALDSDLNLGSKPEDVTAVDLNLVHPLTGPVRIEGAKRGDVLAVTLLDVAPDDYGYTVIIPGFGFLRDKFTNPYIANWKLSRTQAVSEQIPGVVIPFNGFMGTVGVLPGEPETITVTQRTFDEHPNRPTYLAMDNCGDLQYEASRLRNRRSKTTQPLIQRCNDGKQDA